VGDTLFVTVIDVDENRNADEAEMLGDSVTMDGSAKGQPVIEVWVGSLDKVMDREKLSLQETGNDTGIFRSQTGFKIGASNGQFTANNGTLEVLQGYTILARYQDPTDPTDISIDLAKIERTAAKITLTDQAGTPSNSILDVGDKVYVTVEDADKNLNPDEPDQIDNGVTVYNPRTGKSIMVSLTETDKSSGVFRNAEGVVLYDEKGPANPGPISLEVDDKDTVAVFYRAPMSGGTFGGGGSTASCRTDNAAITFERSLPATVSPGETFPVKVTVTAKQNVRALIISDVVNGLSALDATKAGSITPLAPGQSFTFTYRVKAGASGSYRISGQATAITDGTTSLSLDCTVRVGTQAALIKIKPLADVQSNDLIEVTREAPAQAALAMPFTVKITVQAKKKIRALILSDEVDGLRALDTTKAGSITTLEAGESFTYSYRAQCVTNGTFTITGKVTPVEVNVAGSPVSVSSTIVCGGGGVGPITPGPSAGNLGDPNDPSDFALAMFKVAEANPSTVEFTDVTGKAKAEFRVGEDLFVTVKDPDANSDSDTVNRVIVNVYAPYGGGREKVQLVETGINTGVFRNPNSVKLVLAKNDGSDSDGRVGSFAGGKLYVEYRDLQQYGEITQRQDEFDTTYAMASVMSSLAFTVTPAGQKTVAIRFTDDQGKNIGNYKVGMDVFVEVTDADANLQNDLVETVMATVLDRDTMDEEVVTLWETGPNTGVFTNKQGLPLRRPGQPSGCSSACARDGNLQMEDRDFIEAHYQDANNAMDYTATIVNIIPDRPFVDPGTGPKSKAQFTDASGKVLGETIDLTLEKIYLKVTDSSQKGATKLTAVVTQTREGKIVKTLPVTLKETTDGVFVSDAITLGAGQMLEVQANDTLKAEYVDPSDASDKSVVTTMVSPKDFFVSGFEAKGNGKITFRVLGNGIVNTQVMVYDLTGRQVWSKSSAGTTVEWDMTSASNKKLANGVYIFQVIAKGKNQNDRTPSKVMKLAILK
jgi:hypothetical protein